jgi:tryptophan synthase beta chain
MELTKITLSEKEIPKKWYNIAADMPTLTLPPLHPGTGQPAGPDDLKPIFPMSLIEQEVSLKREITIPDAVLDVYTMWRPTPLYRARRFEKALGVEKYAKIYYKWEGVSPPGSHKPNTSVAQAYYNKEAGIRRLSTETGAGQWGSALSFACNIFGLECKVYMVKISYEQKPYRKSMIETWGAQVVPSPSQETNAGRKILEANPKSLGSLGIAISEAVEDAATHSDTNYALGSVLNHVLLHQTIIGQEVQKQFKQVGDYPDVVISCIGGGSNFGGFAFPFIRDKINGKELRVVATEPTACPTLTRGIFAYDFGDTAQMTPLLPMYTLGHDFVPAGIHAGGLRYHGMSPLICQLYRDKLIEVVAYNQTEIFDAAVKFARAEGHIPAPEPAHSIKAVMDEAYKAKEEKKEKVIVFNLCGHGHFDLKAYDDFFANNLEDYPLPEDEIKRALQAIEGLPKPEKLTPPPDPRKKK